MAEEFKIGLDDTYMNVIRFGSGSKVLLIIAGMSTNGLEGQGEGVSAAYHMFAEEYTVCLVERRAVLPIGHSVEDMAEDIFHVLNEVGIRTADVYGVSQGGMIAQCLAVNHPEFVHKIALCSSFCRFTETMGRIYPEWEEASRREDIVGLNRLFFRDVYSPSFLEANAEAVKVLEQVGSAEGCRRFHVMAEACKKFDLSQRIHEISCPVLVLGDENDHVTGAEGSREIAEHLNCELYLYDRFSHAVYDECEEIKDRVFRFFMNR